MSHLVFTKRYWRLVKELAINDFKLRYNNSVLGYLWSLLKPLMMFVTLYVVFSIFMRFPVENYQLFLLLGVILWNYISETTSQGMSSLLNKGSLIDKIKFPKEIIVVASNVTSLITLGLNLMIFFIFLFIIKPHFSLTAILFPLHLLELFILCLGLSFLLSSWYLKYRDLAHIWEIILTIGFWLTPIIYPLSLIPQKYHQLLYINPVARLIEDSRAALIHLTFPTVRHLFLTMLAVLVVFYIGYTVFNKRSKKFAEEL